MPKPVIQVGGLKKYFYQYKKPPGLKGIFTSLFKRQYFTVKAVDDISFTVNPGEIIGFIGPNGAGKTTTIKILSGILHPTQGEVKVLGYTPYQRETAYLKQIALVMGQKMQQLLLDLPAMDALLLNKDIYEISDNDFKRLLSELGGILNVYKFLHIQVRRLSLGQRMRLELLASLIHNPKVIFLDEPTIGLDVTTQQQVRDFFKDYNRRFGTTIILTSHYMEDVQQLSKRIIFINHGRLFFDGSLDDFVKRHAPYKLIKVIFTTKMDKGRVCQLSIKGSSWQKSTDYIWILKTPRNQTADSLNQIFRSWADNIRDIDISEITLSDIVTQIINDDADNS
ncbi:MAG: ATP-binding cassette domain-containing protein [bacterium]|nr:ATP-binding cassette domain-containing protein [bacterium]